jgi:hypothetical protein
MRTQIASPRFTIFTQADRQTQPPMLNDQGLLVDTTTNQPVLTDVFVNGHHIEPSTDVVSARLTFETPDPSVPLRVITPITSPGPRPFKPAATTPP